MLEYFHHSHNSHYLRVAAMKTGSSLNPNAAAYVPLFKRGAADVKKEFGLHQEFNSEDEVGQFGYRHANTQHQNVIQRHSQIAGAPQIAEYPKLKDNYRNEFVASTSQYPEKPSIDEDSDIDLMYMQMNFPEISLESISDVYQVSGCDLYSAIDMLHHLEVLLPEFSVYYLSFETLLPLSENSISLLK